MRSLHELLAARIRIRHLVLVGLASAVVSALIVASALRQSPAERAVIDALRARQVMHATAPAAALAPRATATVSAPAPAVTQGAPDTSGDQSSTTTGSSTTGSGAATDASGTGTGPDATTTITTPGATPPAPPSKVKHVFVITLAATSYAAAFGPSSAAHYLNAALRPKGELLSGYHTLGSAWLPDLIAMVSGQSPNVDTRAECTTFTDFHAGSAPDKAGLVTGPGCVYPNTLLTLGDQLDSATVSWRAYVDGMTAPCQHPDSSAAATATGAYLASRNPFVYFHTLLDLGDCQSDDVPLSRLPGALTSYEKTPRLAFVAADPCDAGAEESPSTGSPARENTAPSSTATVTCPAGPTGIAAADAFLRITVPGILASPAYKRDGALLILFTSPGGTSGHAVRTGALVLSPFTHPGTTNAKPWGPFSVLRTLENVFGLTSLGRAAHAHGFDKAVFTS